MSTMYNIRLSNVVMESIILDTNKTEKNPEGLTLSLHKYQAILCKDLGYLQITDRTSIQSPCQEVLGNSFFVHG